MAERTQVEGASHAPRGLLSRILGIVFSPEETFADIIRAPRVLGVLAFVTIVGVVTIGGFLMTEVGQQAWLDQQEDQAVSWGREMTDDRYAGLEKVAPYVGYITMGTMLVFIPVVTLIVAGLLFAVFNGALGGRARFKELFAVCAHAGVISALGWVFVMPLNYLRESLSSPTNLSVLAPMLEQGSFLASLLGTIDLFIVWWVVVLGIGLAVLYRRSTKPVIGGLLVVYAVIALCIAVARSVMGGS
jgi:Yip1 domain